MSLADLIKSRSSSTSLEGPSAAPGDVSPPVEPAPSEGPSSEELTDPSPGFSGESVSGGTASAPAEQSESQAGESLDSYGVVEVTTPTGLGIYFQAGPKRLYRLKHKTKRNVTEVEVPSMSDVLGILEKGGLSWWGMKVGVQGVLDLLDQKVLDAQYGQLIKEEDGNSPYEPNLEQIVELLQKHKLTVNDTLSKAGDRGTAVHKALEAWAEKKIMPAVSVYPEEEQGYIAGLKQFLIDSGVEAVESEFLVGSWKHKYAGRPDLLGLIPNGAEVFVHRTEKGRGDRAEKIPGGRWLLDLKTSKGVYVSHFLQLEGYEGASIENGREPTDHRGVIHVMPDGRYELKRSTKTFADFLAIRKAYDAVQK